MEAPVKVVCWCGQETYNIEGWCGRCLPMHHGDPPRCQPEPVPVEELACGTDCWSCGQPGSRHPAMEGCYTCAPCDATWNVRPAARTRRLRGTSVLSADGDLRWVDYLDHGDGHYPSPA